MVAEQKLRPMQTDSYSIIQFIFSHNTYAKYTVEGSQEYTDLVIFSVLNHVKV